jgi:hypothetical protein
MGFFIRVISVIRGLFFLIRRGQVLIAGKGHAQNSFEPTMEIERKDAKSQRGKPQPKPENLGLAQRRRVRRENFFSFLYSATSALSARDLVA